MTANPTAETVDRATADYAAYTLMAAALAGLGLGAQRWELIVPFLVAIALHPLYGTHVRPRLSAIGYLTMGLPFAILSKIWSVEGSGGIVDFNTFFYLALYMQAVALLHLYGEHDHERYPRILLLSAIGLALCGADVKKEVYLALVAIFAIASILLLRSNLRYVTAGKEAQKRNFMAILGACLVVVMVWSIVVVGVNETFYKVDQWMLRLVRQVELQTSVGFSNSATLGDIANARHSARDEEIALRAYCADPPGYLRGRVFLKYGAGNWSADGGRLEKKISRPNPGNTVGRFVLPGVSERVAPDPFEEPDMMIYPAKRHKAHYFLPLKATAVETSAVTVVMHPGNAMTAKFVSTAKGYGVFTDPDAPVYDAPDEHGRVPAATRDSVSKAYLHLPESQAMRNALDKKIAAFAPVPQGADTETRVASAIDYFHRTRTYKIGITFQNKDSPLWEWLEMHDSGHCELFASAGTLILRRMGIPARYVTGFVCFEPNGYGDFYVARNRHAHAWVEYFDREHGWRIAEFTPPSGMPHYEKKGGFDAFLEYLRAELDRLSSFLSREGIGGILSLLLEQVGLVGNWIISSWWRLTIAIVLLGLFFYYRLRGRLKRKRGERVPREFPAGIAEQREAYLALEKRLRRQGLGKGEAETLEEYALRLTEAPVEKIPDRDEVVGFVRAYAEARYAPFQ